MIATSGIVAAMINQAQSLISKAEETERDGVDERGAAGLAAMRRAALALIDEAVRLDPQRADRSAQGYQRAADLRARCGASEVAALLTLAQILRDEPKRGIEADVTELRRLRGAIDNLAGDVRKIMDSPVLRLAVLP